MEQGGWSIGSERQVSYFGRHNNHSTSATLEKTYVRSLFDSIAYRYDLLNHVLSGGIDFYWRRKAVECLRDIAPERILDVATGTADFAIATLRLHPREVIGVDIAEHMLAIGRTKVARKRCESIITLRTGEAERLEFGDNTMDAAIVAFGARNFEDLAAGLGEMHRVLRPGGRIVVLEFSRPHNFPFRQIYFFYFRRILPLVGRWISRSPAAYAYLPETVMRFPDGEQFADKLRLTGFRNVHQQRLTFGIATIYSGDK
jgi:demethylmenaquinone methyltransferase/2-methoxy-6-polyprenyl-1,4-benzoquinol methylase